MSQLEEMRVFVRIVEAGSLTGAADQLDVAKSAVSRRLAGLEQRLGARLINRTTRSLALTDAGDMFYRRARDVLGAIDAAEAAVRDASERLAGRIRLAAPLSFGIAHLGPALRDFTDAHPEVRFDVDLNDRQVDLVAEGFDLALRIARLPDSQLAARRLTRVRRVVLASPRWWAEHGMPQTPADLAEHAALEYANAPASALTDYDWQHLDAWAVYPATRFLPQRVRALVDFLAARFGREPYWDDCLRA
jgi:DNA-binding transcriptional LysR family regulator